MRVPVWGLIVAALLAGLASGYLMRPSASLPRPPAPSAAQPAASPRAAAAAVESRCAAGCRESFSDFSIPAISAWRKDAPQADSPFADDGGFFHTRNPAFQPPEGYRLSVPFGPHDAFTVESYSRSLKNPQQLLQVVSDPSDPSNRVLRISSPDHTDGTVLRSTRALGERYEVCARVGHIDMGTGDELNGYNGGESSEPWGQTEATTENGLYFSAIYRSVPQPHNNILAHHERIFFIDSDNNVQHWTTIWDAATRRFFTSGWHPIIMGAADGRSSATPEQGFPFMTEAAGGWNRPGELLAFDAYEEGAWYTTCLSRVENTVTMRISGRFRYGGQTTYEGVMPDAGRLANFYGPHYWLLGDPHINYYEGSFLVDDLTLTVER